MVISKPKGYNRYLLFIVLFYFFIFKDYLEQITPFVGYGDELIGLVVDDGSTDNTKDLIEQLQLKSDFLIRYI